MSVLRAAGAMGAATFLSRILGLVREQVFAVMFGAGNAMDAFNVAFRIPNLLRDLFAEGAMSAAFIPTFTRTRAEQGDRAAWRLAGRVFRFLLVFVSLLSVVGAFFAPELVRLYAGAFETVPGKFELTVRMTRVMFPFFPLVALAAAFMGILNACGVFFLPAFASALFNLASIIVGVAAAWWVTHYGGPHGWLPIEGMAVGVLAGGLVQAFSQIPKLYRVGYRYPRREASDPSWSQDPGLRRILALLVPGTVGLAATQVNLLVNTVLATSQGPGAVSWLNYAFRLLQFPIGIFGVSLAAATLPRVSQLWVKRDYAGTEALLQKSLKQVLAVNLPAAAGLAFLAVPILQLLFQYGRFYFEDVRATAWALGLYAIGLPAYSAVKVLVPAFYAMGNTRVPVLSSVMAVGLTVGLNLAWVGTLGYRGLALGTSVAACANAFFLLVAARRELARQGTRLGLGSLAASLALNLLIALSMGALCWGLQTLWMQHLPDDIFVRLTSSKVLPVVRALRVGVLMAVGIGWVLIVGRLLKVAELTEVQDLFWSRIKKKLEGRRT